MTHKKKDCLERPRKKGAKFTNKDIKADEVIQDVELGYAAKRDRWNGYNPAEHKRIYAEYAAVEAARQKLREEEIDNQTTTDLAAVRKMAKAGKQEKKEDADFGSSDEEDADEDKYADAADAVGQKLDAKTRITVRNLRIREDTAKYLMNLDPSSAYYDPKTRSMRDAPDKNVAPEDVRSSFSFLSFPLSYDSPRQNSRVKTFSDIAEKLQRFNSYSFLHGKQPLEETTSTSMLILLKESFSTKNSKRNDRSSKKAQRAASLPNMEERSIYRLPQKSSDKVRRKTTSNILVLVKSSKVMNEQRQGRNIQRMVSLFILCYYQSACSRAL